MKNKTKEEKKSHSPRCVLTMTLAQQTEFFLYINKFTLKHKHAGSFFYYFDCFGDSWACYLKV